MIDTIAANCCCCIRWWHSQLHTADQTCSGGLALQARKNTVSFIVYMLWRDGLGKVGQLFLRHTLNMLSSCCTPSSSSSFVTAERWLVLVVVVNCGDRTHQGTCPISTSQTDKQRDAIFAPLQCATIATFSHCRRTQKDAQAHLSHRLFDESVSNWPPIHL